MDKHLCVYKSLGKCAYGIILFFMGFVYFPLYSQSPEMQDTIQPARVQVIDQDTVYHSPRKAALYSAMLPGLGQIYNGKFWKLPIIYAGFGTLGYFIVFNNVKFQEFKQAYKDYPDYKLDYPYQLTEEQIEQGMIFYRRYRDLSILGTCGFYLFQILDATVDAHLFDWDVGEDISLRIQPSVLPPSLINKGNSFGLSACLSF